MNKLFDIHVHLTGFSQVKSPKATVNFISFDGFCEAPFFTGKIIEGGVDTQKFVEGQTGTLSARYILKGKDNKGKDTSIFIENNGIFNEDGTITTSPWIITDNDDLRGLFERPLSGKVIPQDTPEHNQVLIEIYSDR
jgi:hypothetical protein